MKNCRKNALKSRNGITLIALVITIIVLLILAGISISMLSGDNGILRRATDAKEKTSIAQEEESAKLTFTEVQMELSQGKTVDTTAFQKMIDGNFGTGNANGIIAGTTYIIKVQDARTYAMSSNGNIATLDKYPIDDNPGVLEQSGDIYTINCIEDLVALSYNVNSGAESYEGKTVTLGRNLDFKDDLSYADATSKYKKDENGYTRDSESETSIKSFMTNAEGVGFIPILGFDGNFDGKEKSLSNLFINSSSLGGLFGNIDAEIEICNLSLNLCNIKGNSSTGGLIGILSKKITIDNVHVSGKVESTAPVGGIIGVVNTDLKITNCSNDSYVKSTSPAGGITYGASNSNSKLSIINCHNTGKVESTYAVAGGIAEGNVDEIINCYNSGDVIAPNSNAAGILMAGENSEDSIIINCYNEGKIESKYNSGGINNSGVYSIINCYNNGEIVGDLIAGGIKASSFGIIRNCYNFNNINSGIAAGICPGGSQIIDNCYNSGNVTSKNSDSASGIAVTKTTTITNCHNCGNIIGGNQSKLGEILADGSGTVNNTNSYLKKESNANANGAVEKIKEEMDEIMSVQSFVTLMNSYVTNNNNDSTKTKLKTWKLENGLPVFAE